MAMIPPNSQEGWYYDHWFAKRKPPSVYPRGKRALVTIAFLALAAGGVAVAAAAPPPVVAISQTW
ncbi:MAG: hypothetical protein WBQ75_20790 [Acetobacteraceae bacterium]